MYLIICVTVTEACDARDDAQSVIAANKKNELIS